MTERPIVQIGSLDVFHLPALHAGLSKDFHAEFFSTWSPFREPPNPGLKSSNAWLLHYMVRLYQMFPKLSFYNYTFLELCKIFDTWFTSKLRPDLNILCFLSGFGTKALHWAKKRGIPVVVDCGSTHTDFQHRIVFDEYKRNGRMYPLFPESYRNRIRSEFEYADFIQIPSEFVKRTFLEAGIPNEKLLMASYGTNLDRFTTRSKSDVHTIFKVICPSGVNLRKGARILVESWRKLGWSMKEAELHWIGSPNRNDVKHLFRDPLPGVVWHEFMDHHSLAKLYKSCDVLVLPSFEEGFARVLIEGAACGQALMATPNTGVEELFSPERAEGWLIPSGDVEALCAALKEAKNNRDKTFEMGQNAAKRALSNFSWIDYGKRVNKNFHFVLGDQSMAEQL